MVSFYPEALHAGRTRRHGQAPSQTWSKCPFELKVMFWLLAEGCVERVTRFSTGLN
jgi:hypothetical protein